MANYNYAHFITEALDSVLGQDYSEWEVIVCDDGSVDDSCRIVESYAAGDDRIRLVRQSNAGVGAALNAAYAESRGDIVCLLDADDFFLQAKLAAVVEKMSRESRVGFVQHAMDVVDEGGARIRRLPAAGVFEEGWIADRVKRRGGRWRSMPASALCLRREVAELLFPMPASSLRSMADAYLYMLAPLITEVGFIDRAMAGYRLHETNLTGSTQLTPAVTEKFLDGFARVFASVAEKRIQLAYPLPELNALDHLTYREHRYMQMLFEGAGIGELLRSCHELARRIRNDDLYTPARKALGMAVFAVAPFLPRNLRPAWIDLALGSGIRKYGLRTTPPLLDEEGQSYT